MTTTRRQFSREFKLEAVRLAKESGKPQAQVARELGIRPDMLRSWKRQAEGRAGFVVEDVFPGHVQGSSQDDEVRRLRREVDQLKQERDFLKKAAAYFAKESR
jgi:transposase